MITGVKIATDGSISTVTIEDPSKHPADALKALADDAYYIGEIDVASVGMRVIISDPDSSQIENEKATKLIKTHGDERASQNSAIGPVLVVGIAADNHNTSLTQNQVALINGL